MREPGRQALDQALGAACDANDVTVAGHLADALGDLNLEGAAWDLEGAVKRQLVAEYILWCHELRSLLEDEHAPWGSVAQWSADEALGPIGSTTSAQLAAAISKRMEVPVGEVQAMITELRELNRQTGIWPFWYDTDPEGWESREESAAEPG